MSLPPPLIPEEDRFHAHMPLAAESIIPNIENCRWNCLQKVAWNQAINSYQFKSLTTRREQILFLFNELCNTQVPIDMRFSHAEIAEQFNISRQCAEKEAKKALKGVKEPHRPSILTNDEIQTLKVFIAESFQKQEWPTYEDISFYVQTEFKKALKMDSLRTLMKRVFKEIGKFIMAEPIEDSRFEVSTKAIDEYYDRLQEIINLIDYRFCFNLDETGEDEFVDTREVKVFVPLDFSQKKAKIPVRRSNKRFTIEHCICTDGTYFPVFLIIPRKTVESDLFKIYNTDDIIFRTQTKGFMNITLFQEYFQNVFLFNLKLKRQKFNYNGPALLIMDNLLAHKKAVNCPADQNYIFLQNENLHVLFLVPHSSDQTQPLDLGIFANQKRYSQNISKMKDFSNSTNLINKAIQGMQQASTTRSIISAFEAAGICRKVQNIISYDSFCISLYVDKTKCRAVRHYSSQAHISQNQSNPPQRRILLH